ncbi:aminotransferase-like domain-containing protein [Streptomyces sp. TE33382]
MHVSVEQLAGALGEWRGAGLPLARALASAVREAVLDGRLRVGAALPAERRIATRLGISRGTVVSALNMLREDGWVQTRHGSASTVRLPSHAAERIAPLPAGGTGPGIDLRKAAPAAPQLTYLAAAARALAGAAPVLAQDGSCGAGWPALRAAIAERYTAQALPTRPEQILVTSGTRASMGLLATYLAPHAVALENPTYSRAISLLGMGRARVAGIRVATDGWDTGQLRTAFAAVRGGMAYLVPDFHNPTGALMDTRTRRTVAELAAEHQVTVVADETLRDVNLTAGPIRHPRIRDAILIGSLSKAIWGGVRVGWIRAPRATLITELQHHTSYEALSAPPMEQLIATELLEDLDALLRRRCAGLRAQRDHLAALLADDPRWEFTLPDGGLVLWLRLTGTTAHTVVTHARRAGLELTAGQTFAADGTLTRHLRIPFTSPPDVLDRIATTLDQACPH